MLTIEHLTKSHGERTVIDDLSFSLPQKCGVVAIVGPSGCGKTTLLSLIAATAKETRGRIVHDYKKIAVAFQEPRLIDHLNLKENLNFVLPNCDKESGLFEMLVKKLDLAACQKTPAKALSGGEKQRASLLRAFAFGGDLVLLDEPFTALDPQRKKAVCELIESASANALILVTAHDKTDVDCLDAEILYTVGTPITALEKAN